MNLSEFPADAVGANHATPGPPEGGTLAPGDSWEASNPKMGALGPSTTEDIPLTLPSPRRAGRVARSAG
jgi:hypothetical protein